MKLAAKAGADVVVIDGMEGGTGASPDLLQEHTGIPTLAAVCEARKLGVAGFLSKDQNVAQIAQALEEVASGGAVFEAALTT